MPGTETIEYSAKLKWSHAKKRKKSTGKKRRSEWSNSEHGLTREQTVRGRIFLKSWRTRCRATYASPTAICKDCRTAKGIQYPLSYADAGRNNLMIGGGWSCLSTQVESAHFDPDSEGGMILFLDNRLRQLHGIRAPQSFWIASKPSEVGGCRCIHLVSAWQTKVSNFQNVKNISEWPKSLGQFLSVCRPLDIWFSKGLHVLQEQTSLPILLHLHRTSSNERYLIISFLLFVWCCCCCCWQNC